MHQQCIYLSPWPLHDILFDKFEDTTRETVAIYFLDKRELESSTMMSIDLLFQNYEIIMKLYSVLEKML